GVEHVTTITTIHKCNYEVVYVPFTPGNEFEEGNQLQGYSMKFSMKKTNIDTSYRYTVDKDWLKLFNQDYSTTIYSYVDNDGVETITGIVETESKSRFLVFVESVLDY
ncbi:MAG: hypothetical protein HUJ61_08105, partial [Bacilli bacterium]|nr:hypothetical protein [Bacilli bacterium]